MMPGISTRSSGVTAQPDVFTMNADGTDIIQITDSEANALGKPLSPDDSRVVVDFAGLTPSGTHLAKGDIVVIEIHSGGAINLTSSPGVSEEHPDWSPARRRQRGGRRARRRAG